MEINEKRNLAEPRFINERAEQGGHSEVGDEVEELATPDFSKTPTELRGDDSIPKVENLNVITLSPIETGVSAVAVAEAAPFKSQEVELLEKMLEHGIAKGEEESMQEMINGFSQSPEEIKL